MAGRPRRHGGAPASGSGIQPDGSWVAEFLDQRPPFAKDNAVALKHGSYVSPLRLSARAAEIADAVRPLLPAASPAYETTLHAYSLLLARVEKAAAGLEEMEADPARQEAAERLLKDLRLWLLAGLRFGSELGLTPASTARIWKDSGVGKAARASAALRELDLHLESRYGEPGEDGGPEA